MLCEPRLESLLMISEPSRGGTAATDASPVRVENGWVGAMIARLAHSSLSCSSEKDVVRGMKVNDLTEDKSMLGKAVVQ